MMSRIAAPSSDVTIPIFCGSAGRARLRAGVEQPLFLEPLLQLIECELLRPEPVRLEMLADELVLALRLVHRNPSARDDPHTINRLELQIPQRRSEHEAAQLGGSVLQREIQMARRPDFAIGELALDPDLVELGFERVAQPDRQLGDR